MKKIFENWQYKLLSLGFAIFFWYMVIGQQQSEITIEIPIEFQNVPENYVIVNNPVNKVSILLSGPSPIIKTLTKENISFPVDLSKIKTGKNEIYLYPDMLRLPRKVNVKLINPSKFLIDVDKLEKRTFAVIPKFIGNIKKGYKITSIKVEPPTVDVISIHRELKKFRAIETQPINIQNKFKSFETIVPLNVKLKYLKSINPEKVKVIVKIEEDLVQISFKNIKIKIKSDLDLKEYKIKLIPNNVNIKIKVNSLKKKLISKKDFEAYVQINSIGEVQYPVKINYPRNIQLVDYSPKNIKIIFEKVKKRNKK